MRLANSYPVWVFATIVIGIVIFQAITFIRLAERTRESVGMTGKEMKSALKVGAINAIGPAMSSLIIAISLITFLGNPLTFMRSVVIGSSATEAAGANLAATAFGTELGADGFNEQAYTLIVWTLCLGGIGWLLVTVFFTKSLGKMQEKFSNEKGSGRGGLMAIISSAAMIGVFGNFVSAELMKGLANSVVVITAALSMFIILLIAKKLNMKWLIEWSLGFSILSALTVGYFISL
ncbi:translation elongation factor EF-1alpha [Bacillus sp. SA1-12]|nr:translation elongation factor EF-1alpha [Bacillus sp. SA1-12]